MKAYRAIKTTSLSSVPLSETGFPSPAADHRESALSLDELLVQHPSATFYVRAEGHSMEASGIYNGDLLVVDRSLNARDGNVIIASVDDQIMVRRLICRGTDVWLASGCSKEPPMRVTGDTDWFVWGVVTYVIHHVQSPAS